SSGQEAGVGGGGSSAAGHHLRGAEEGAELPGVGCGLSRPRPKQGTSEAPAAEAAGEAGREGDGSRRGPGHRIAARCASWRDAPYVRNVRPKDDFQSSELRTPFAQEG